MGNNLFGALINAVGADADERMEGDYVADDGLLCCGTCHEPKVRVLPIPVFMRDEYGESIQRPRECLCQRRRIALQEAAKEDKRHREAVARLLSVGLKDERLLSCTFAADDGQEARTGETCRRYAEKWAEMRAKNIGMILWGQVGSGKTFYAAAIANALIEREVGVILTGLPDIAARMSADYGDDREDVLNEIRNIPLLILDDVGFERTTPTGLENAYTILNTRYQSGRPLIVTTNLTPDEIKSPPDIAHKRALDRIVEMCPVVLQSKTARRQGIAAEKRMDALEILYGRSGAEGG
jgi:DNA replication protein DnaC